MATKEIQVLLDRSDNPEVQVDQDINGRSRMRFVQEDGLPSCIWLSCWNLPTRGPTGPGSSPK